MKVAWNYKLKDLYVHELKDLYSAENQLLKALPKMAKAAANSQLSKGFTDHLAQTEQHVARLEAILKSLEETTRGPKCKGMEGLIKEGDKMIKEDAEDEVRDAGLISAAQRAEHYEMAGEGVRALEKTLDEEAATDQKLTKLAKSTINVEAVA